MLSSACTSDRSLATYAQRNEFAKPSPNSFHESSDAHHRIHFPKHEIIHEPRSRRVSHELYIFLFQNDCQIHRTTDSQASTCGPLVGSLPSTECNSLSSKQWDRVRFPASAILFVHDRSRSSRGTCFLCATLGCFGFPTHGVGQPSQRAHFELR